MPSSVNITQGKAATASSFVMPYNPSRAIDGSLEKYSRWLCASSTSSWLMVNLGGYYKLTSWGVTSIGQAGWDPSCNLCSFKLQSSSTPILSPYWIDVPGQAVTNNAANVYNSNLTTPVVANAVRVYITQGDRRTGSTLASILNFVAMGYPVSSNANLSGLIMSNGTLSPSFSPSITAYTATVPYSISTTTLTPTAQDPDATITVNGQVVVSGAASNPINLNVGSNPVTVTVKSPDTTVTKTYTVTITRQGNVNLSNLTLSSGTLSPSFAPGVFTYNATVASSVSSITVTPTAQDTSSQITVNGVAVPSGTESGSITLSLETTNVAIVVSSTAGGNSQTYTVAVKKASPYLTGLTISSGAFNEPFAKNTYAYTANVDNSVSSITVTPTAEDTSATITVNSIPVSSGTASQPVSLNEGANTITVIVTPIAGASQTYTITVTRASGVCLTGLTVVSKPTAGGTLTPGFTSGNTSYSITVPSTTSILAITATAPNSSYVITVNNSAATSGVAKSIPYIATVNVKVTYNGVSVTYVVNVSK